MRELTLITVNLANLGEWTDEVRIQRFVDSIVYDLNAPMILAVQEIGGYATSDEQPVHAVVTDMIIKLLDECHGVTYQYSDVPPLPESSGGAESMNIRCGFFYRLPVHLDELIALGGESAYFVGDEMGECVSSRLPLLGRFQLNGISFTVINCHLKSMSLKEQNKKQAKKQRNRQAEYIANYVIEKGLLKQLLFIVGDMNDTFASKTVQAMVRVGLDSVHSQLSYQVYTYRHHKKPILLDYILYNDKVTDIEGYIYHINADKRDDGAYSDHDPIGMQCQLC